MTAFSIIAGGLAGCGGNGDNGEEMGSPARYDGYNDNMNTNYSNRYDGRDNDRGEGPITDMMTVDDRRNHDRADTRNRGEIGDRQGMVGERGMLNVNDGDTAANGYSSDMADKIVENVEDMDGVDDATAVVRDNDVLIGIDTYDDEEKAKKLADDIKKRVEDALNDDKEVHVTTDEEQYGELRNIDEGLRNGGLELEEAGDTINDMVSDLGNAARRPFEDR
ncbi:YhcN/YlaJ family sporulation lipoprotein [Alteribacillus sp. HJP-4]|uniref:YhcN/YlaJ family sporulation lipoprotein n=1 Tax=Alteribacillus sp. HJP-4 TaxID=2775394 RepID=UPI0035CD2076